MEAVGLDHGPPWNHEGRRFLAAAHRHRACDTTGLAGIFCRRSRTLRYSAAALSRSGYFAPGSVISNVRTRVVLNPGSTLSRWKSADEQSGRDRERARVRLSETRSALRDSSASGPDPRNAGRLTSGLPRDFSRTAPAGASPKRTPVSNVTASVNANTAGSS